MGSEFRYALGKVLSTQDRPTLRLASHYYVLHINLIKNIFNTCIYTHTHTSIHLSIQYEILIPKQHTYPSTPKKKRTQHIKETLAFIYYVKTCHTSNTCHKPSVNKLETLIMDLSMFHHIPCQSTNAWTLLMHDLPSTYLSATQHLWHHEWACECMFMASRQEINIKP